MNAGREAVARVAVRGEATLVDAVADAVADAGAAHVADGADPDALVVAGESALSALAEDAPGVPVLPVEAGAGRLSVPRSSLPGAVSAVVDGVARTVAHPVLSVGVDGEATARALLDVSLVADRPARISEFAVHEGGETVDAFRADGVTVATPAGSDGYARAAGGPVLGPGTGVAVVPVAPFTTRSDAWVFRPPVTLTVERDESPVVLVVDGEDVREVSVGAAARVEEAGTVEFLRVPDR
jgi:NAD+ kinase